ncbi:MAG: hypothetical protein ABL986_14005 [Vicinamibacterales bacterium]
MSRSNIFDAVNQRIWDFVHERANSQLRPATGSYSTLFRGSLFGATTAAGVAAKLAKQRVDVLWLGANPCIPRSLGYILNPPNGKGDLPIFERQMKSGLFSSARWDDQGEPLPDWSPIERPDGNWRVYRDVLEAIGRLDRVAMANFIPWGSQTTDTLLRKLGATHAPLLKRMLAFADEVNAEIVEALNPKLVVVPFSLGRNRLLNDVVETGVALAGVSGTQRHTVAGANGAFSFYTGACQRGGLTVPVVFLRHPASLRLSKEAKPRVVEKVATAIGKL